MAKRKFIFDETYIKRYAKKDKVKWLVIGVSALVLILIVIIVILANHKTPDKPKPAEPSYELKDELVIEAGSSIPEAVDYFKKLENIDVNDISVVYPEDFEISYDTTFCTDEENEQISNATQEELNNFACVSKTIKTLATYGVTIKVMDKEFTINLVIRDTKGPNIVTKSLEIYAGSKYAVEDFVEVCSDVSGECNLSFVLDDIDDEGNVIDYTSYTTPGTYRIRLFATDAYDNKSEPIDTELKVLESLVTLYNVTFNSNGGSEVSSVTVPENGKITEPEAPTREGYNFVGWYNGNAKYNFDTAVTKDITLTARWQKIGSGGQEIPGVIKVSSIQLNFKKISLGVGESKNVTAYVYPNNATNKAVSWTSSDNSIATVSNGKITGVKAGSVTITATADGKSASVSVTVKDGSGAVGCSYGDSNYNNQYVLSVNLISNNCAVNPNGSYNQVSAVAARELQKLNSDLSNMGLSTQENYFKHKETYTNVKNTSGTGLVGVQITVSITVIDPDNPYIHMTSEYIIKPDGSRQFISNNVKKNNVTLN